MLIKIIDLLFSCYLFMLFVRVMSSWVPEYRDHPIIRFVAFYTDPYLNLFRRIIPPFGMIDLSPIVAFFSLQLIEIFIKNLVR